MTLEIMLGCMAFDSFFIYLFIFYFLNKNFKSISQRTHMCAHNTHTHMYTRSHVHTQMCTRTCVDTHYIEAMMWQLRLRGWLSVILA
jgi:hypothetical protein